MLVNPDSTEYFARREAGGKGLHLFQLHREGFPVPAWRVLGVSTFAAYCAANDLEAAIQQHLQTLAPDDGGSPEKLEAVSAAIGQLIAAAPMPPEIECDIESAFESLRSPIAVRSSAVAEDSAQYSFAGQLSSFLNLPTLYDARSAVRQCWASAYSARSLGYRLQHGLPLVMSAEVAVVFQEMIPCEKSGVLFTCDPVAQDPTRCIVNAVHGLGEGLVSGALDADQFVLEKATGKLIEQEVVCKETQVEVAKQSGIETRAVSTDLQKTPVLNASELKSLSCLGRKVEEFYQYPQDIEWGKHNGKFVLLQSRPVTTPMPNPAGKLFIWDNSNIVESYGGITLPLTFTWARFVYGRVYVQFCEILGVPAAEIRRMDPTLRNMLGSFHGRIYYNLLNWYRLTSILPGFKYNRTFMETMMGTDECLADEIAERLQPSGFQGKLSSKVRRFFTGLKFLGYHFRIQSIVDDFLKYFHTVYDEFRARDYSRMRADDIHGHFEDLLARLLTEWKAPIVNDYLCMVHFGLLKKLTQKWLGNLEDSLQNDLMCGNGNLESAEPTRELIRMAALANRTKSLPELLKNTPAADCHEALQQSGFGEFKSRVVDYISKYGFRCMNEMKLEEIDLHQDPTFLYVCLRNYLRTGELDLDKYDQREEKIRTRAEAQVREHLCGWRYWIYRWSLKHARKAVRNRENTRFCRTRIYGVVRAMFHGIGRDFAVHGILQEPEDIFFITLEELNGAMTAHLTGQDLQALVCQRKTEYATYESMEPAARFTTRGPVYWQNTHGAEEEVALVFDETSNTIQGLGCCPGVVEGNVKCVKSPSDDLDLNGEILFAPRTDPGWIPLYPSLSGLLVERGGLLSHSAIVAREMGLPTVVGLKGVGHRLQTGMRVRVDGRSGHVEILED
ncbi:MAG: phosphoenolpyruvate synthase [Verrucomicrobiota bacterium]|jgi:pyruvate,water dikinase|nr:phosphoenolpyruvate synthase [Verrucomicrobiota bacterium]